MENQIIRLKIAVSSVVVAAILVAAGLVGLDLLAQGWDAAMEGARAVCAGYACLLPFAGAVVCFFAYRLGGK